MKARYGDILDTITGYIRSAHGDYAGEYSAYPSECTTGAYRRGTICACVAIPLWFDKNGTPRFAEHHPSLAPNIYAYEVALLRIECAGCEMPFDVQLDWSSMDDVHVFNRWKQAVDKGVDVGGSEEFMARARLSGQIRSGVIHYGDPPRHVYPDAERCAGETMNCNDISVLEFWRRDESTKHEWARVPELEIDLPDADINEPDAAEGGTS